MTLTQRIKLYNRNSTDIGSIELLERKKKRHESFLVRHRNYKSNSSQVLVL